MLRTPAADLRAPIRRDMPPTSIDELPIDLQGTARQLVAVLAGEFVGVAGVPTVERLVVESIYDVLPGDDLQSLGSQVEAAARALLQSAAAPAVSTAPALLFLCVHNAGRSQLAAGWARALAGDAVRVVSAGSDPAASVNPLVVDAMAEVGIDLTAEHPSRWTDELVGAADVVVTMGCGEACPVVPGVRYVDWDVADPNETDLATARAVRDELRDRVAGLLDDLGLGPT